MSDTRDEAYRLARKWCFENGGENRWDSSHFYELAEVMRDYAKAAIAQARKDALEDAARLANEVSDRGGYMDCYQMRKVIEDAIRALQVADAGTETKR